MTGPRSLQARLALGIGILLTLLWVSTAVMVSWVLRRDLDRVFDATLQETTQRLLPLAVLDIIGREEEGVTQRLGAVREHIEFFTYIVRDAQGRILLQSHAADPSIFPVYDGPGFRQAGAYRLFSDEALKGSVRITVAEPLDHRADILRKLQLSLVLPLLVAVPLTLLGVALAVRASLSPLRRFRDALAARSAKNLLPVQLSDLPAEILPVAETFNNLLARLQAAFEAERSFVANAAHELRTPLAGAIAQAQRLESETSDREARRRAGEIENTLKRLTKLAERLMQLARAEGGRLRLDHSTDLRTIARLILADAKESLGSSRVRLSLPQEPLLSDLDPDAFGILCRNLVDNALHHGEPDQVVEVVLSAPGVLTVTNKGPPVPPAQLKRLTQRFERNGSSASTGSGLGLAIVAAICERSGSRLLLSSPRPGHSTGFEAKVILPKPEQQQEPMASP